MEHSPLVEAVRNGNIEIVKILFEMKGTDVREVTGDNQNSTLHVAAANGHNDIVSLLVENGVNIHARNIRWINILNLVNLFKSTWIDDKIILLAQPLNADTNF